MKKKLVLLIGMFVLVTGITAFAASSTTKTGRGFGYQIMTNVVSKLTGLSTDEVIKARESGKSFLDISKSKGVTEDAFKDEAYNQKVAAIDERVKDGYLSKEQGEALKSQIKERIANCTGNGQGNGMGMGRGNGRGMNGAGMGRNFGNGNCFMNQTSK